VLFPPLCFNLVFPAGEGTAKEIESPPDGGTGAYAESVESASAEREKEGLPQFRFWLVELWRRVRK